MIRRLGPVLVSAALAACSDAPPGMPGPDARPPDGPDAAVQSARGLEFVFSVDPAFATPFEDGEYEVRVTRIDTRLEALRVIGDSASGDDRTRQSEFETRWLGDEADRLEFIDAPPGIYSWLRAELAAYRVEGECEIEDTEYEFRLEQDLDTRLSVDVQLGSADLEPGMRLEIPVRIDPRAAVTGVSWEEIESDEGELRPEDPNHPALATTRNNLQQLLGESDAAVE